MPHARLLLQEWPVARRELRQARPARQRLRIGYSTDLPQQRLAALLGGFAAAHPDVAMAPLEQTAATLRRRQRGRASCRARVCPYGSILVDAVPFKNT